MPKTVSIFLGALTVFVVLLMLYMVHDDSQRDKSFRSLPTSEHLMLAKRLLAANQVDEAIRHLQEIPSAAPESEEGVKLLVEARTLKLQQEAERQQQQKESDSSLFSYWPTTVRIQTDMNSFWLDQEERICVSYPDDHGTVAVVHCGASERPESHNIPVTFWGSVDRGTSNSL